MSYAGAQARYDAMLPDETDDDIYEMDALTLHAALAVHDCDELSGRRYHDCERRVKLIQARIIELDRENEMNLQQLHQQHESAVICRAKLEKAALANPDHGVVAALLEARAAEEACAAELQKALWLEMEEAA